MTKVDKPWGYYEDYFRGDKAVFKKIVINPDEAISYQLHRGRDEFWYIASGSAALVIEDETNDIINAEKQQDIYSFSTALKENDFKVLKYIGYFLGAGW